MKKYFISVFYLVLLACAVQAAAVDFRDSFSDSGRDIDSDGKFDFLDLDIDVRVNQRGEYTFLGWIKAAGGNYHETKTTVDFGSTGNKVVRLSFDGNDLYVSKITGEYNLSYVQVLHSDDPLMPPTRINEFSEGYLTREYSYLEFDKPEGNAAVYCANSPCYANVESRDNIIGKAEFNSPNTVDGCEDGHKGVYLMDESIEDITVESLSGEEFTVGDKLRVSVKAYCWGRTDRINFVYANDSEFPDFRVVSNAYCGSFGMKEFVKEFYLDNVTGNHTFRAIIQNSGSVSDTCGKGDFDDNDDVSFLVRDGRCHDEDEDGYGDPGSYLCTYPELDCDDSVGNVNPRMEENCSNSIDDDCNGKIDILDSECQQEGIFLKKGWNLVSLAYDFDDNSVQNVFDGLGDDLLGVYTFEMDWKFYVPGNAGSNLEAVNPNKGYWVEMREDGFLQISAERVSQVTYKMHEGWNLISYPGNSSGNLNSVGGKYLGAFSYDGNWSKVDEIVADSALWVKLSNNQTWVYNDSYHALSEIISFDIGLKEGWNLFSIPLKLENYSIGSALSSIDGCYSDIWMYDGNWSSADGPVNLLSELDNEHGYLINMGEDCTLSLSGQVLEQRELELKEGLNLIGWPSMDQGNLIANATFWTLNNSDWISPYNGIDGLEPGKGYFVLSD